jgi:hypothetical protein
VAGDRLVGAGKENKKIFIYHLFNDAFSISDYIASNEGMIVTNELERMCKEAVVA